MQGILIYPVWSKHAVETFEQLWKDHYPLVLMSSNGTKNNFDMVYADQEIGGYLATEHLIKLGHKKIAIISNDRLKSRGFRAALSDYGCPLNEDLITPMSAQSYQWGYDAAERLFTNYRGQFTAVFATTDRSAIGFMKYCREHHIRIPEDVALVGYDNNEVTPFMDPPLTTIPYDIVEEAEQAVNLLMNRIDSGFSGKFPIQIQIKPELIVRQSCGQPNAQRPPVL